MSRLKFTSSSLFGHTGSSLLLLECPFSCSVLQLHLVTVMPDNMSSITPSGFMNAPNQQQLPLQNNNPGMQIHPQNATGIHQNWKPFMTNMQPTINPPAFMHAANNFLPLQNNQLVQPPMNLAGPTPQQGQFHVGFVPQNVVGNLNCNPMFPVQGQNIMNGAQINLSQTQGHILAHNILSLLQQNSMNMNMPNGQFCAPLPLQNMNQQLPMQVSNTAQVVPYGMPPGSHPMFGFPNQASEAMFPQNPFLSANSQLGLVPGNQVRPQVNLNEKNMFPPANTNSFMSLPLASQQLERNTLAPLNSSSMQPYHTKHSQHAFANSQANPNSNVKANVPNSNWKGSPGKNFKNKSNQGGFQGGFQKSKFHDNNKGQRKFGGPKDHRHKGINHERAENSGVNSKEQKQELKRSFTMTYTEPEIQQWREARRKNYPSKENIQKKQSEHLNELKVIGKDFLRKELKEILAKQAELGVEVAEIPSYYLKDSEKQSHEREEKRNFNNKRKFQNRKDRYSKKQKFVNKDFSNGPSLEKRKPTLLQKLLSADIKRDKSHLLQVFRFMVMNSFFKDWPDKPLSYPSVVVKENGFVEKYLHSGNDVPDSGNGTTDQKPVNLKKDNDGDGSEDGNNDSYENDSTEQVSSHKEESDDGGIEESDEEEGEIID